MKSIVATIGTCICIVALAFLCLWLFLEQLLEGMFVKNTGPKR